MSRKNEKEIMSRCYITIGRLVDIIKRCEECVEILVDYSLVRHPYVSATAYILSCVNDQETCEDILYMDVIDITTKVDALYRDIVDLDKDVILFRVRCGGSWLEYGYTVSRHSSSVYSLVKDWSINYEGRRIVGGLGKDICNGIESLVTELVKKIRLIMESEGII